MGDIVIDFTKWRLGRPVTVKRNTAWRGPRRVPNEVIEKCSKCGRYGVKKETFVHKVRGRKDPYAPGGSSLEPIDECSLSKL